MTAFTLPELPYAYDALVPYMTAETFEYHHGKHHNAYVVKGNELLEGSDLAGGTLEDVVRKAHAAGNAGLFNNTAQNWNHSLFWKSMKPNGGGDIPGTLQAEIVKAFGSVEDFRGKFIEAGMTQFGSGWAWLVMAADGSLEITRTANAETPLTQGKTPLLTCDVWEHSYYIDYRNARPKYLEAFFDHLANWEFAAENFEKGPTV